MAPSDSAHSVASSIEGSSLNRAGSSKGGHSGRSPSWQDERRHSIASRSHDDTDDEDVGMQTIAQMLQQDSDQTKQMSTMPSRDRVAPGTATFTGKMDRNVSGHRGPTQTPLSTGGHSPDIKPSHGFFSMPILEKESQVSPFFNDARRASEGDDNARESPQRPELPKDDSSLTVTQSGVLNDSTEGEGSGLPQKDRPPVGVPQEKPSGVNFRDYPGPAQGSAENNSFTTGPGFQNHTPSRRNVSADPPTAAEQPSTRQPELQQPSPPTVGKGGIEGLIRRGSTLEYDESGERTLVHDFTGIVRLDEPGSSLVAGGSTAGTKGSQTSNGGSAGPTGFRLAQQQRQISAVNSKARDSVQDFVLEQAHTVNFSDPNAPAPSFAPDPVEQAKNLDLVSVSQGRVEPSAMPPNPDQMEGETPNWGESSGTSLSAKDSSEIATASGDEFASGQEEDAPIITFRFEHSTTNDGHHVVVGREGKLQRCEDEPITTPGAVQGFGVLIVLEEDYDSGRLLVRQVSEVSGALPSRLNRVR